MLQALALLVLLAYELSPDFKRALDELGAYKESVGVIAPILSTAVFGGLLPYLFFLLTGKLKAGSRLAVLIFYLLFWTAKGFEIDLLYRVQAAWFGSERAFGVIFRKTIVDQFVYGPLWAAPSLTFAFLWKDAGFSGKTLRARLEEQSFGTRYLVMLVSNWVVWIPAVAIIYALPSALQILLSNLVLTFWTLISTFVSQTSSASSHKPA